MSTVALLETRGVSQKFGGLVANNDISIAVARGEIVGLIGPNGAGKSTLFNLIAGVAPPSNGSIWFDGENVTALPATARCHRGIARTFQVVKSFEGMSVIDNVIVGALVRARGVRAARDKAFEVLDFTGLRSRADALAIDLVRRIRELGTTILMVEHVMEIVMPLVDRAIVLDLGSVLAEGKPADVVRNPAVISAYLGERHRARSA